MSDPAPGRSAASSLREHGLRPRKRLGQNFLRDKRFLARILEAADIGSDDVVLEVGAGTGILTRALLGQARRVVAVELDDSLVEVLGHELSGHQNLELWHGNALDFDPCARFSGPYKLVGNIPYYITGPIIRHFLETECPPSVLVLMVQREVADRMTARPGDLSLLGVSVQFYSEPKLVTRVPRGAFHPAPKVESAIVKLTPRPEQMPGRTRDAFFRLARAGFGTRRKTLGKALSIGLDVPRDTARSLLESAGIDERRRAEDLSIEEWVRLAEVYDPSHPGMPHEDYDRIDTG